MMTHHCIQKDWKGTKHHCIGVHWCTMRCFKQMPLAAVAADAPGGACPASASRSRWTRHGWLPVPSPAATPSHCEFLRTIPSCSKGHRQCMRNELHVKLQLKSCPFSHRDRHLACPGNGRSFSEWACEALFVTTSQSHSEASLLPVNDACLQPMKPPAVHGLQHAHQLCEDSRSFSLVSRAQLLSQAQQGLWDAFADTTGYVAGYRVGFHVIVLPQGRNRRNPMHSLAQVTARLGNKSSVDCSHSVSATSGQSETFAGTPDITNVVYPGRKQGWPTYSRNTYCLGLGRGSEAVDIRQTSEAECLQAECLQDSGAFYRELC